MQPDQSACLEFLTLLYGETPPGHLVTWAKGKKDSRTACHTDLASAAHTLAAEARLRNAYFGIGLQREPPKKGSRGVEKDVVAIPGFWVDIDVEGPAHRPKEGERNAPTFEEAEKVARSFPLAPTLVIHSGNGLQVWWLFPQPWQFSADWEWVQARALSDRFQDFFRRPEVNPDGWKVDETADLARILRPAGTLNRKLEHRLADLPNLISNAERAVQRLQEAARECGDNDDGKALGGAEKALADLREELDLLQRTDCTPPLVHVLNAAPESRYPPELFLEVLDQHAPVVETAPPAPPPPAQAAPSTSSGDSGRPSVAERALAYLEKMGPAIEGQNGEDHTKRAVYAAAVRFGGPRGLSESEALTVLIEWDRQNTPPWEVTHPGALAKKVAYTVSRTDASKFGDLVDEELERPARPPRPTDWPPPPTPEEPEPPGTPPAAEKPKKRPSRSVVEILGEAPVPDDVVVPYSYDLTPAGVTQDRENKRGELYTVPIADCPILVSGRLVNYESGLEQSRLSWFRDDSWRHGIFEREVLASSAKVLKLANHGVPVTSSSAKNLVDYLAAFENANLRSIPRLYTTGHMGWQGRDGDRGFLVGRTLVDRDGTILTTPEAEAALGGSLQLWPSGALMFRGGDAGDEQAAKAFHEAGTFEAWREAIAPIQHYPRVLLAFYAAFASPLVAILGLTNFLLDISGDSTGGKTTTLRILASPWGNPSEVDGIIQQWEMTRVFRERISALHSGIPLFIDETKRAKKAEDVAQAVYDLAGGRGRGRGSLEGTQVSSSFRGVTLTTGEQQITSFMSRDGGSHVRALCLTRPPFGDSAQQDTVNSIREGIRENFGHAGPRFVGYLLRNRALWKDLRSTYRDGRAGYEREAAGNGPNSAVVSRLAEPFACINVAALIAHHALELPWQYQDPIRDVLPELLEEAQGVDRSAAAVTAILGWAAANPGALWNGANKDVAQPDPPAGWAGRWDRVKTLKSDDAAWETLDLIPERLRELLNRFGYEPEGVLKSWRNRDWLLLNDIRRARANTRYVRLKNQDGSTVPTAMISLRRSALAEAGLAVVDTAAGDNASDNGAKLDFSEASCVL